MTLTFASVDREKITPMMQQYLQEKDKWPDSLLFFRLGDFYELFFDDALTAARELELRPGLKGAYVWCAPPCSR